MFRRYEFDSLNWDELIELYKYWSLYYWESQEMVTVLKLLSLVPAPTDIKVTAGIRGVTLYKSTEKSLSIQIDTENKIYMAYNSGHRIEAKTISYKDVLEIIEIKIWSLRR